MGPTHIFKNVYRIHQSVASYNISTKAKESQVKFYDIVILHTNCKQAVPEVVPSLCYV